MDLLPTTELFTILSIILLAAGLTAALWIIMIVCFISEKEVHVYC